MSAKTLDRAYRALELAEATGNTEDVRILKDAIRQLSPRRPAFVEEEQRLRKERGASLDRLRRLESGPIENLMSGFGSGAVNTYEQAALGGATLLNERNESAVRDRIRGSAEAMRPEGGDPESILYNIGSGLGSIATTGAATLAGGLAAGPAGAIVAGTAAGVGTQVGEASERARAQGLPEEARNRAITDPRILGAGALETVPFLKAIGKFSKPAEDKLGKIFSPDEVKGIQKRLSSASATGGVEAIQELAQTVAQNVVEKGYNPNKVLFADAKEAAGYGGATGFIFQALVDMLPGRSRSTSSPEEDVAEEAPTVFPDPEEDRKAQAEARERLDEDQGDMFAVELEQTRRRVGTPEEEAPSTPFGRRQKDAPAKKPAQGDLVDQAETQEIDELIDADETAEIERMVAADKEQPKKQSKEELAAVNEAVKKASKVESFNLLQDTRANNAQEQLREFTLRKVMDETDTKNYNTLEKTFERALKARGPRAGEPAPTPAERTKIRTFLNLGRSAAQSGDVEKPSVSSKEQTALESLVPEKRAQKERKPKEEVTDGGDESVGLSDRDSRVSDGADTTRVGVGARSGRDSQREGMEQTADTGQPTTPKKRPLGDVGGSAGVPARGGRREYGTLKLDQTKFGTAENSTYDVKDGDEVVGEVKYSPKKRVIKNRKQVGTGAFVAKLDNGQEVIAESVPKVKQALAAAQTKTKRTTAKTKTTTPKATKTSSGTKPSRTPPGAKQVKPVQKQVSTKVDQKQKSAASKKRDAQEDTIAAKYVGTEKTQEIAVEKVRSGLINTNLNDVSSANIEKVYAAAYEKPVRASTKDPRTGKSTRASLTETQKELVGMQAYFRKGVRVVDALEFLAYDIAFNTPKYQKTGESIPELNAMYAQQGGNNAKLAYKWAKENLSGDVVRKLDKRIGQLKRQDAKTEAESEARDKAKADKEAGVEPVEIDKEYREDQTKRTRDFELPSEVDILDPDTYDEYYNNFDQFDTPLSMKLDRRDYEALGRPVHPSVEALLRKGDLKNAVLALGATVESTRLRQVATLLSRYTGNTDVRVAEYNDPDARRALIAKANEENVSTDSIAGFFISRPFEGMTNTIVLSPVDITAETLLHELSHAATLETLRNPSHPMTKALEKLFADTKPNLGTAYGTKDVQEFIAEAFGNPEFRVALDGIYPDAKDVSALRRFLNIIGNWFRALRGKSKITVEALAQGRSAGDQVDAMIQQILNPAPNIGTAATKENMNQPAALSGTKENVNKILEGIKEVTGNSFTRSEETRFGDRVYDFVVNASNRVGKILYDALGSQALADQAKKIDATLGKLANKVHVTLETQRAELQKVDDRLKATSYRTAAWMKSHPEKEDLYNDVVYTSTTEQVDPSNPRSKYEKNEAKLAVYKELRKKWDKLGPEGQAVYIDMRDQYKSLFDRLKAVVLAEAGDAKDSKTGEKLGDVLTRKLFDKRSLEPYFPLLREGNFKLVYETKAEVLEATARDERAFKRDKVTVLMFNTRKERERAIAKLENDPTVERNEDGSLMIEIGDNGQIDYTSKDAVPPTAFVRNILTQLEQAQVDSAVTNQILNMYIDALPESSYAKSLKAREGSPGYKVDAVYTFNRKAYDLGRQVARLEVGNSLRDLRAELGEYKKVMDKKMETDPKLAERLKGFDNAATSILQRTDFGIKPTTPYQNLSQAANRLAFFYTIGFNASSALVNASQIPLFVMPYFGARYGYKKTGTAIREAARIITSSTSTRQLRALGKDKDVMTVKGQISIDNYFAPNAEGILELRTDIKFPDEATKKRVQELQPLVQAALDRGRLNQSYLADELELTQSGRAQTFVDKATKMSAFMFHNVEIYNRQVAMTSAYLLELDRLRGGDPKKKLSAAQYQEAADTALYRETQTNGGAVTETGSRLAQNDLGRVALMYKNYGMQMYYTMLQSFNAATSGLSKEDRSVARKELAGVLGTSLLMAGAQGVPMYGAVRLLFNMFADDDEEDFDSVVRRNLSSELLFKGVPTFVTGADVASRIGLAGLLIQTNKYNPDASPEEQIFHYLAGPFGSTMKGFYRGGQDISRGQYERGIESMLPAAVRNAYKGLVRYPRDGGALTRRGDPIFADMNYGDLGAQIFGFAPVEYTRTQEQNMLLKRIDKSVNEKRSSLTKKLYIAERMGDYAAADKIMDEIYKFNDKHPTAALSGKAIKKSMKSHAATSETMHNGVSINKNMREALAELREDIYGGL